MKKIIKVTVLIAVLIISLICGIRIGIREAVPSTDPLPAGQTTDVYDIPAYSGSPYIVIDNNVPFFTDDELSAESFEYSSELDPLGRCGVCVASIGPDSMPTEDRWAIGNVRPSGWHTVKYSEIIEDDYLYNRCHLIGYQLTGENSNINNLITGTRYLNMEGMLPFENMVADFVKETGYHVMYRVTPVFAGDNLVADGVLMEAKSVEDNGSGILFHVFCYNVQPGIYIDYATGDSMEDGSVAAEEKSTPAPADIPAAAGTYAVNSNNGKIHITGACPATVDKDHAMKRPVYFDTYEEAEAFSVQIAPLQEKRLCGNCWQ